MGNIAGSRKLQTYPEAARAIVPPVLSDAIVHIGFSNTEAQVVYAPGDAQPILKTGGGARMQVTLTGFTPGNVILVFFSIGSVDDEEATPNGAVFSGYPVFDLGAGFRKILQSPGFSVPGPTTFTPNNAMSVFTRTNSVRPIPQEVTSDPVVGVDIDVTSADSVRVPAYSATMCVIELDVASPTILTLPSSVLV